MGLAACAGPSGGPGPGTSTHVTLYVFDGNDVSTTTLAIRRIELDSQEALVDSAWLAYLATPTRRRCRRRAGSCGCGRRPCRPAAPRPPSPRPRRHRTRARRSARTPSARRRARHARVRAARCSPSTGSGSSGTSRRSRRAASDPIPRRRPRTWMRDAPRSPCTHCARLGQRRGVRARSPQSMITAPSERRRGRRTRSRSHAACGEGTHPRSVRQAAQPGGEVRGPPRQQRSCRSPQRAATYPNASRISTRWRRSATASTSTRRTAATRRRCRTTWPPGCASPGGLGTRRFPDPASLDRCATGLRRRRRRRTWTA